MLLPPSAGMSVLSRDRKSHPYTSVRSIQMNAFSGDDTADLRSFLSLRFVQRNETTSSRDGSYIAEAARRRRAGQNKMPRSSPVPIMVPRNVTLSHAALLYGSATGWRRDNLSLSEGRDSSKF